MKRPFIKFLLWTFGITYACWGGLAILIQTGVLYFTHPVAVVLHLLGGFGPPAAALLACREMRSPKILLRMMVGCNRKYLGYFILFCILEIAVVGFSSMEPNPQMPLYLVPVVFLQAALIYGGNEELGWRGTMQPMLEKKMPFWLAALVTGLVWAAWHIPLWFVDGASQQSIPFVWFAALAVLQSYWYASIYKRTQCVFCCNLIHGLTNTLLSLFVIKINVALIVGFLLMTACSIYMWYSPKSTA